MNIRIPHPTEKGLHVTVPPYRRRWDHLLDFPILLSFEKGPEENQWFNVYAGGESGYLIVPSRKDLREEYYIIRKSPTEYLMQVRNRENVETMMNSKDHLPHFMEQLKIDCDAAENEDNFETEMLSEVTTTRAPTEPNIEEKVMGFVALTPSENDEVIAGVKIELHKMTIEGEVLFEVREICHQENEIFYYMVTNANERVALTEIKQPDEFLHIFTKQMKRKESFRFELDEIEYEITPRLYYPSLQHHNFDHVVIISDPHVCFQRKKMDETLSSLQKLTGNTDRTLVIITGDITDHGTDKEIQLFHYLVRLSDFPYRNICPMIGNHDTYMYHGCFGRSVEKFNSFYSNFFGILDMYHSDKISHHNDVFKNHMFEIIHKNEKERFRISKCNYRFICIDSTSDAHDSNLLRTCSGTIYHQTLIDLDTRLTELEALKREKENDLEVIVLLHHSMEEPFINIIEGNVTDAKKFKDVIKKHEFVVKKVIFGHTHFHPNASGKIKIDDHKVVYLINLDAFFKLENVSMTTNFYRIYPSVQMQ